MPDNETPANEEHRERRRVERESRVLDRFKTSQKGFRRVFEGHFGEASPQVESIVYHLASAEAKLPTTREAFRLARYPGAGDRDPRRFAMGLWENLSVLHKHLASAMEALEALAHSGALPPAEDAGAAADDDGEDDDA